MHDHRSHSLLQQLPLSVSPFIHLPTAITLPYSYQTLPLSLPPSTTTSNPAGYIVSPSGTFTTTPSAVVNACQTLISHLQAQRTAAEQSLRDWEKGIEDRELMEKRRVAPGYLDTGLRILEPVRLEGPKTQQQTQQQQQQQGDDGGGEELDRVFGKMGV